MNLALLLLLAVAMAIASAAGVGGVGCGRTCDLALGSYYLSNNVNLTYIASLFNVANYQDIQAYNPSITNPDFIVAGDRLNVPFKCGCVTPLSGGAAPFLGGVVQYTFLKGDTYSRVATLYANLTTVNLLEETNSYSAVDVPAGATVNVTVPCSCGDQAVSSDYGLFLTYPMRPGENLSSVAAAFNFSDQPELLQKYNPGVNFSAGNATVFIPVRDPSGSYDPLQLSGGTSAGVIAGIVIAAAVVIFVAVSVFIYYRRRKTRQSALLLTSYEDHSPHAGSSDNFMNADGTRPAAVMAVDKSVEFSYEELSQATNGFSIATKIGQGGFGSVYYAELRGQKVAIKKMEMQSSEQFLAELKVLTHVHHLNLVRLIGYCIESYLFLVYEYIENGNLSQRLRGSGWEPLSWANRVQIALDSARGLEYIHEHTVPVYIHRDIKSANILIDKNLRAKVADFGLTKLTEVGSTTGLSRGVVGTFGYMPPEYAVGEVSAKVDVFAFGVVLFELISAKEAIVRSETSEGESKGLSVLFKEALAKPDQQEAVRDLVDPKLGDDYPIDSILKMAQLAKACTQEDPKLRPTMRSAVVTLMAISSASEFWDVNSLYGNLDMVNRMGGR